jgi:nucleoside-diphosphate-sugar epimerase
VAVCLILIYLFQPFMNSEMIVVCGGGGFAGGHLLADLLRRSNRTIRSADSKPSDGWCQNFPEVENLPFDLRERTMRGRDNSVLLPASA